MEDEKDDEEPWREDRQADIRIPSWTIESTRIGLSPAHLSDENLVAPAILFFASPRKTDLQHLDRLSWGAM